MSYQCLDKDREIHLRRDSEGILPDINHIIFDFDGVLVSTSQSYRQTIRRVVDYYFLDILGLEGKEGKLVTLEDIQGFKDTGLYNDDWNLTSTLTKYYLALLMKKLEKKGVLEVFVERFSEINFQDVTSFLTPLEEVGSFLRSHGLDAIELVNMKNNSGLSLDSLMVHVKSKNQTDLDSYIQKSLPQIGSEQHALISRLVPFDLTEPDLLKRLFEEVYLGAELFERFYNVPSIFNFQESYIDKEVFIPKKNTLDTLYSQFGKFGIYSEKPKRQGIYLLKRDNLTEYFDEEICIFREDLLNSEKNSPKDEITSLGKPNPELFIKLMKKLRGRVAYVGDGIADVLLVEKTRLRGVSTIMFFGTLSSSQSPDRLLLQFRDHMADAVMMDVNDIPHISYKLGEDLK
ncbi:MAG: HAD family hydrolase [Thermoproteota archaeon]